MVRPLLAATFAVCTLALSAAVPVAAAKAPPRHTAPHAVTRGRIAPADEYFGRFKLSVLGVRSKVKDLGFDADLHPEHRAAVLSNARWVEDAMRDWARKYPFDRWLPRYAWALEQMYERIPGDESHRRALRQLAYITAYFPQTAYGRVGRAKLAAGIATPDPAVPLAPLDELQRLAVIDGRTAPSLATPEPATPAPSPSPSPEPSAEPSLRPLPSAAPATAAPKR